MSLLIWALRYCSESSTESLRGFCCLPWREHTHETFKNYDEHRDASLIASRTIWISILKTYHSLYTPVKNGWIGWENSLKNTDTMCTGIHAIKFQNAVCTSYVGIVWYGKPMRMSWCIKMEKWYLIPNIQVFGKTAGSHIFWLWKSPLDDIYRNAIMWIPHYTQRRLYRSSNEVRYRLLCGSGINWYQAVALLWLRLEKYKPKKLFWFVSRCILGGSVFPFRPLAWYGHEYEQQMAQ